jgi:hypothetical protein
MSNHIKSVNVASKPFSGSRCNTICPTGEVADGPTWKYGVHVERVERGAGFAPASAFSLLVNGQPARTVEFDSSGRLFDVLDNTGTAVVDPGEVIETMP